MTNIRPRRDRIDPLAIVEEDRAETRTTERRHALSAVGVASADEVGDEHVRDNEVLIPHRQGMLTACGEAYTCDNQPMNSLVDRLNERLAATGQSARAASIRAGLGPDAIRNVLTGRSGSPKMSTVRALAQALDTTIPYLMGETDRKARLAVDPATAAFVSLPVSHTVAAGPWHAVDDYVDDEPETLLVQSVPGFEGCPQWLERVQGDSFNKLISPGSFVHVVDAIATGYEPRSGDIVVVVRSRAQGALVERTLKQVELTSAGIELWPRSHNPRWDKPILITEGLQDHEDDVEVRVAGRVLRAFMDFSSNRG